MIYQKWVRILCTYVHSLVYLLVRIKLSINLLASGFLDPSASEDDLKAGTNVEIPLWLAESLHSRRPPLVAVDLPKIYKDSYREILNADACTVDMHKLSQYFYEFGCYIAKHDIKGEVSNTLINVRLGPYICYF